MFNKDVNLCVCVRVCERELCEPFKNSHLARFELGLRADAAVFMLGF